MDKQKILNLRNCETEIDMYLKCLDNNTDPRECTEKMVMYLKCLDKDKPRNEELNKKIRQKHFDAYDVVRMVR